MKKMKNWLLICCCLGFPLVFNGAEKEETGEIYIYLNTLAKNGLNDEEGDKGEMNLKFPQHNIARKGLQESRSNLFQEEKELNDTLIIMSIVPDLMKFSTDTIEVRAGQQVVLELENADGMQHNMLIIMPGTLEKVGAAADALARDPKGAQKEYVPDTPDVLYATALLDPDDIATLTFEAPKEPGLYPFVCTFPGHWRMMNGIMKVTK